MTNKRLLGSHNSWTFRSPVKWWQKPLHFIARCQGMPIDWQIAFGMRVFDLRVKFHLGVAHIHHGIFDFGEIDGNDLALLNGTGRAYVRVVLESNKEMSDQFEQEANFYKFCCDLKETYPNIIFFGGNRKFDWKVVYDFGTEDIELLDMYSSVQKWHKWCPWLYALYHNRENLTAFYADQNLVGKCFFYDFIDIK